jgi:hypothetical protein
VTYALIQLFPELGWAKFSTDERALVLRNLGGFGVYGPLAAEYICARSVQFGYFPQASSGAGWTLLGNLILPPGSDLGHQRILAVIIHEVLHLQQSLGTRLSIYGELLGWQLEHKAYLAATGKRYGEKGLPFEGSQAAWDELCGLSADSYTDLARAQSLMKQVSPVYRAEQLPLYPLGRELRQALARRFQRAV